MVAAHERLAQARLDEASGLHVGSLLIDGQRLRIGIRPARPEAAPSRARRPLLLFNGIGANLELCAPLMAQLPERESIVFDAPGAGLSPAPKRPYHMAWLARLASLLLDELGCGPQVDVLGVSWGGALAQQFALQCGSRVGRLILAATSTGGLTSMPGRPAAWLKVLSLPRYRDQALMQREAPAIYGGRLRDDPAAARRYAERAMGGDPAGYRYQLLAMLGWSSLPWLWAIRQPTLVLAGSEDPLVPLVNARMLAMLLPHARLCVVEDGHLFLLTQARQLAPVITSFLDDPSVPTR